MRGSWVVALVGGALLLPLPAHAQPAAPYEDPPFADECEFHRYGEGEAPPLDALPDDDPLCVEYQKRDITISTGGAVEFLLAEPARFAAALDKCRYWQVDFWSVQVAPDTPAIVRWDGSYWFDRGAGFGAVRAKNFAIGEQPASAHEVADVLEAISPDLAEEIRTYADADGGGGMRFDLGGGDPTCPAATPPDDEPPPGDEPGPDDEPAPDDDDARRRGPLPVTGAGLALAGIAALLAGSVARRR